MNYEVYYIEANNEDEALEQAREQLEEELDWELDNDSDLDSYEIEDEDVEEDEEDENGNIVSWAVKFRYSFNWRYGNEDGYESSVRYGW